MIKEFNTFLNEKLGVMEQVAQMTNIIWDKYRYAPTDKPFIMNDLESDDFKIKKLTIDHFRDENTVTKMMFYYSDSIIDKNGNYNVYMKQNSFYKKEKSGLHHELIHAYKHFKDKGSSWDKHFGEFNKVDDIYFEERMSESDYIILNEFLYVAYLCDINEIAAYYNEDIFYYRENSTKFRKFKYFLKNCHTYLHYQSVKDYDVEELKKIENTELMKDLVGTYYDVRNDFKEIYHPKGYKNRFEYFKDLFLTTFRLNKKEKKIVITQNEIDAFIRKMKKEIEYKKRIYIKYVGKLRVMIEK